MIQNKVLIYGNEKMFSNIPDQASQGVMHVPLEVCQVVTGSALADVFILRVTVFILRVTFCLYQVILVCTYRSNVKFSL